MPSGIPKHLGSTQMIERECALMQAIIESPEQMAEKRIETYIVEQLKGEQTKITDRLDKIEERLSEFGKEIGKIQGLLENKPEPSWFMRYVLPSIITGLSVAGIVGMITGFIALNGRISTLEGKVNGSEAGVRLENTAVSPADPRSIADAKQILQTAKKQKQTIPADVVRSVGDKFLAASDNTPAAWDAAIACADYRSFLNIRDAVFATPISSVPANWNYSFDFGHAQPGLTTLQFKVSFAGGLVKGESAAKAEHMGKPQPQPEMRPAWLIAEPVEPNTLVILDDHIEKNVVYVGFTIEYDGGPVVLDNVIFVNCTFRMKSGPRQAALGKTLIASSRVTFTTAG